MFRTETVNGRYNTGRKTACMTKSCMQLPRNNADTAKCMLTLAYVRSLLASFVFEQFSDVSRQITLGGLSTASDNAINAQVQGQFFRECRPRGEHRLFVYWGCAAVKSMFSIVCVRGTGGFFSLDSLARSGGSATLGYAQPYALRIEVCPGSAGV